MQELATCDAVCFDVDSTVIREEGIDVLAESLGKGPEVAALTRQAMEGGMKFQDALKLRLDLLQPSRRDIERCLERNPLQLSDGVAEFVRTLQKRGKQVFLVSGGFRIMIEPVARSLGVDPSTHVVANTIHFHEDDDDDDEGGGIGRYAGFDPTEPTSADMGKPKALQSILDAHSSTVSKLVMIGDGATDAQAKPPAAAFIGYGGVARRQTVVEQADWFVTDFRLLTRVVDEYGGGK